LEIATDSQAIFSWQALTYLAGNSAVFAFNEASSYPDQHSGEKKRCRADLTRF
jgi:hypothetical protein